MRILNIITIALTALPFADVVTAQEPVVGPIDPSVAGTCAHRRKIQTLQANQPAQFNMLILALDGIMMDAENKDTSYFSIAGIHGAPNVPWQMPQPGTVGAINYNRNLGYCYHGSPLFNTWHRPYLLLIEQNIVKRAIQIANRFTDPTVKASYLTAARTLRLPYWDWADSKTQSVFPPIVMQPTVSVTRPVNGVAQKVTIPNPFYRYRFHERSRLASQGFGSFANSEYTVRHPTTNWVSQDSRGSAAMQNGFTTRRSSTFTALTAQSAFNSFTNALESLHNDVHVRSGGSNPQGHLNAIPFSSFDPLFWLHHANVDRLFALWQAIRPGVQMTTKSPGTPTYANVVINGLPADTTSTNLYPFKHKSGAYWTSRDVPDVKSIWKYGYGFDELQCSFASMTTEALREQVVKQVNTLYGPSTTVVPLKRAVASPPSFSGVQNTFIIRLNIDKSEIPGSWTSHFFLGPPPSSNVLDFAVAKNRIGTISQFGTPHVAMMSRPFTAELTVTEAMISAGIGRDFSVDKITGLLNGTDNSLNVNMKKKFEFNWVLSTEDNKIIDLEKIKSLRVGVYFRTTLYPADKGKLPMYLERKFLGLITRGRKGGMKNEKELDEVVLVDGTVVKTEV